MSAAKSMNFFCTGTTVWSSPNKGQLHDALPGPDTGTWKSGKGGSARSVPSVDSTIVFRLPTTTKRHGVIHGSVDSGVAGPPREISRTPGKSMAYSVLRQGASNREPQ